MQHVTLQNLGGKVKNKDADLLMCRNTDVHFKAANVSPNSTEKICMQCCLNRDVCTDDASFLSHYTL